MHRIDLINDTSINIPSSYDISYNSNWVTVSDNDVVVYVINVSSVVFIHYNTKEI